MQQRFLIVGQGLAGSLVGLSLIEHEQAVTIVDDANPGAASRVAAGIMNPVSGQRMVVGSEVVQCLPHAITRYQQLSHLLSRNFYHPLPLLRLFQHKQDKDRYRSRCEDPLYADYMGNDFLPGQSGEPINKSCAGYRQQQSGYLDIKTLLNSARDYFRSKAALIDVAFNYSEVCVNENGITWQDQYYDHIIFCEGIGMLGNPWFRWLPFQLSKGEVISIHSPQNLPHSIINKGRWLLPQGNNEAVAGATYQWEWTDELPSSEAQQALLDACCEMLGEVSEVQVTSHQAGIRPTTRDKQPFIGTHPQYKRLHCCNGFGSRAAMLAPMYSEQLVEHLLEQKPLPEAVDIQRFQQDRYLVVQARQFISEHIVSGDIVIDATTGNGNDTELLAVCVGQQGRVFGFDTQPQAIKNTRQRLQRTGLLGRVTLLQEDHALIIRHLPNYMMGKVSLITFNLGFLPGSDKRHTTNAETTIAALNDALKTLKIDGSIVIMTYTGHDCGKKETKRVKQWLDQLDEGVFEVKTTEAQQKIDAPSLYVITKTKKLA